MCFLHISEQGLKKNSTLLPHFFHIMVTFSLGETIMLTYALAGIGSFIGNSPFCCSWKIYPHLDAIQASKKKLNWCKHVRDTQINLQDL